MLHWQKWIEKSLKDHLLHCLHQSSHLLLQDLHSRTDFKYFKFNSIPYLVAILRQYHQVIHQFNFKFHSLRPPHPYPCSNQISFHQHFLTHSLIISFLSFALFLTTWLGLTNFLSGQLCFNFLTLSAREFSEPHALECNLMYRRKEFLRIETVYWLQLEPLIDGVDKYYKFTWFGSLNIKLTFYFIKNINFFK